MTRPWSNLFIQERRGGEGGVRGAALSILGVPSLPGFWSKFLLLRAVLTQGGALFTLAACTRAGW
ncbi:MAG: hypothetical protein FD153_816 [Rhodospirillaceae bacterium]|nr:MAG: hypothetical protein FD153_816 [Rhodospirillaceae bacterium]